jgi:hypothetical protein
MQTITKPGKFVVFQQTQVRQPSQTTIAGAPDFEAVKHLLRDKPLRRPNRRRPVNG